MHHPFCGYPPAQINQVSEPSKFWDPKNDDEKILFEEAKQEVKLFLMSKNEGVDVNKMLEMIKKYGTIGEVKFKEMGFNNFNEFLFHIDDVHELRTQGTVLYLFFKGEVDENLIHIRQFVFEQKKDPGLMRFIAKKENTYLVPSYYLVQPPKPGFLVYPRHHLLPNPQPFFHQQQHPYYYQSGWMQVPQFYGKYMGTPLHHQFQQNYNMPNVCQNHSLQYQLAYNQQQQQQRQVMMGVFPNHYYQQLNHAQNFQQPVFNQHLQNPVLAIHPKPPCPIHSLNSPQSAKTATTTISSNQESDKENTNLINENQTSTSSDLEPINNPILNFKNPNTIPARALLASDETTSSKTQKKPQRKRKISLKEAVEKMLENQLKQTNCDKIELHDKKVEGEQDSSTCSSSSSSSTIVPDSSEIPISSNPSVSLFPALPVTKSNSNSSLQDEVTIEDFKFATISPHSDEKETIKEKVTTRNFTSLQQSVNDLLEEEEEMRKEQEEKKKTKISNKNSTEKFINLVENANHSDVEVKENSYVQDQHNNNVTIKSKVNQNFITVKQIQLVNCSRIPYRLLGVDSYSHFILQPSDPKVNEYFDKEMEKMNEFYASVGNQNKYHLNLDDMKTGMFVVIRVPSVKQGDKSMTEMKTTRYLRAKIFCMEEDEDKTGFISCLGIDDFIEYMVNWNDIFSLKVQFSRPTARTIMTILEGTEECFCLSDTAKAFRKCQIQLKTRIHPIVKVKLVQDKHPLFQCPVVKIETKDGRDLFKILLDISPSIKKVFGETSCKLNGNVNDSLHSFSMYQKQVFVELLKRGYIGNEYSNS